MNQQSRTHVIFGNTTEATNTILNEIIQIIQGITAVPRKLKFNLPSVFESRFTRIAKNTTKYYLELNNNYINRFKDEASLLATAGVLTAQNYIFIRNPKISHRDLIHLARDIVSRRQLFRQDILISYVIGLEIELLRIDKLNSSDSDIVKVCSRKVRNITWSIQKTMDQYISKPAFALATAKFMESSQFERFRKEFGIKN